MVDRIENNVFATQDYVEKAIEHTKKAVEYQTKSRRVNYTILFKGRNG
jgi:t-SNARE complex subunit (syntaxin)